MQQIKMNQQSIRQLTGERFFQRGLQYFQNGKVYGLSYNPSTNAWRGLVKGTKIYTVRIYFDEGMGVDTTCNCAAFAKYDTCKHVAAVLLAITEDVQSNRKRYAVDKKAEVQNQSETDLFAKQLMHTFRNKQESDQTPEPVQSEFIISVTRANKHNQYALSIEMKMGDKRPYVIRDIRAFLKAMEQQESYKVNQSFTFYPEVHYFPPQDREIIDWLLICYEQEKLFGNSHMMKMEQPRGLYVPTSASDALLDQITDTQFTFKLGQHREFHHIHFEPLTDQFEFQLDYLQQGAYTLELSELSSYYFLESYRYVIYENYIYKVSQQQKQVLDKLFRILPFQTRKKQRISPQEMDTFVRSVMPQFEQIGELKMTERMEKQMNTSPFHGKVYIDNVEGALKVDIEFHYGETIFNPFQHQQTSEKITKRDYAQEQYLMQWLRDSEFLEMNQAMFLFHDDAIYHFLHEKLELLKQFVSVYVSQSVKKLINENAQPLQSQVDYRPSEGMLDIHFDMEGISQEDVTNILKALIEKKRYYRIPDGPLLHLESDSFQAFQKLQEQMQWSKKQIEEDKISIPAARGFQVEQALEKTDNRFSQSFQKMLDQLKNPSQLQFSLPENLEADLRDYQQVGFQWMKTLSYYHLGGILADDMGLGKTLQTISFLLSEINSKSQNYQALVVAPASLLYNWQKEVEKFAPTLSSAVIIGSKQQREHLLQVHQETDILITSYPTLRKDENLYQSKPFDCLILDEAQAIKNHLTLTAKAVRSIQAKQYFALSGTPIENALDELWSIFYTISPGLFGNKKAFSQMDTNFIAKMTRPFILRRVKKDVLEELPDKIETVRYSELTKSQKEVYVAYLQRIQQELNETIQEKGFEKGKLQILAGLTRLRQVCCHPSLFLENYSGTSGKLEQLMELMAELEAQGKRTLIFSQFSSMLQIIRKTLEEKGYDVFYLDGSTPSEKRLKMVEAFNNGENGIFLISLKAGGTGLNLTGADTVVLYDLWWNPAVEEQAAGRAHRIGQENVVQVIRFITEGTIEEKIYQLQQKKRELVDQIIKPGETLLTKLTETEIRELLQFNEKQEE
ncbi:DEAD/DEAH box helicase [Gracilibacillus sp. YIM 98692]|uniref:DEAD/DEAH box helicase n=1 Tax=Gracilibacillus sp. YIM 98692 TaxID=2663532 RepID=UPI0013D3517B|nr:DEAD/DEAH box helicase [Gracilibacillus sp. YIM 98692]